MANNTSSSPEPLTISGIVSESGGDFDGNNQDFDILLQALNTADLVDALDDADADLSVFAPTDAAFVSLAQDLGYEGTDEAEAFGAIVDGLTELGNGDPVPLLEDILLYHVSPGAKDQSQLQAQGQVDTLLEGASFTVEGDELLDNEPDLENPSFIPELADISAANGTIQGIDRVLIPLDIPGNDMTDSTQSDILLSFNIGESSITFDLGNIVEFFNDSFMGQTDMTTHDDLFGDLSLQSFDNSTTILGGDNTLAEFSGIFSDLLM